MTARMFINGVRIDAPTKDPVELEVQPDVPKKHAHTGPCRCIKVPAQDQPPMKGVTRGGH